MQDKGKITMMQAVLLYAVATYSASMRIIPKYTVNLAKQAAWLCPLAGLASIAIIIFVIYSFVNKYPNKSMPDIFNIICGKAFGKVIIAIYIIWLTILLSLYVRYFGERLVSSIYPATDNKVFIVVLLFLVFFILRKGLVILGRMNKIVFVLLTLQFFLIVGLLLINVNFKFITPISSLDVVPVIKGSLAYTGIGIYLFYFFMVSDKIITNRGYLKNMTWITIFSFVSITILLISLIGTFGHLTLNKLPLPLLMAVKNISIKGNFSGLEALFISLWVMADFITVSVFSYIIIKLLKSLFNLDLHIPLLSILLIFIYILSQFLAVDIFELQQFSSKFALQANVATGFFIPILIFIVGKLRRKL